MDDEEQSYHSLQEPLYRVETGNYEYRLVLRCRQDARARFASLRSDVQVKIELLDNKHVQHVVQQLQRFLSHMTVFHDECHSLFEGQRFFPIEVDLTKGAFTYESVGGPLPTVCSGKNLPVAARDAFVDVADQEKNKETFLEAVRLFYTKDAQRRGHVEFIYAALKHMEEFGVNRDLQAYKEIVDVFPKGKFIAQNMFQVEFMHYPKQQQCCIDVLEQMEDNGVMPDAEMEQTLINIFGKQAYPVRKLMRMSYWMPKFKNLSPWPLPQTLPNSTLELAKLAVERMGSVDPATKIHVFHTRELPDSIDDTWIVSGQSVTQQELLEKMNDNQTVYVEGAFQLWLRRTSVNYFILRADPIKPSEEDVAEQSKFNPDDVSMLKSWLLGDENLTKKDVIVQPSVHEQEDGIILAIGVTGSSSKDSLLSWIRFLEKQNPRLAHLPVLFATHSPLGDIVPAIECRSNTENRQITDGS
nr:EOG090X07J4 [Cyclestheria hislopi]